MTTPTEAFRDDLPKDELGEIDWAKVDRKTRASLYPAEMIEADPYLKQWVEEGPEPEMPTEQG